MTKTQVCDRICRFKALLRQFKNSYAGIVGQHRIMLPITSLEDCQSRYRKNGVFFRFASFNCTHNLTAHNLVNRMKTKMTLLSPAPSAILGLAATLLVSSAPAFSQPVPLGAPVLKVDECGRKGWCYITAYPDGSREARANPVTDISYPPAGVPVKFVADHQQTGIEINEADLLGALNTQRLMIQNNP